MSLKEELTLEHGNFCFDLIYCLLFRFLLLQTWTLHLVNYIAIPILFCNINPVWNHFLAILTSTDPGMGDSQTPDFGILVYNLTVQVRIFLGPYFPFSNTFVLLYAAKLLPSEISNHTAVGIFSMFTSNLFFSCVYKTHILHLLRSYTILCAGA